MGVLTVAAKDRSHFDQKYNSDGLPARPADGLPTRNSSNPSADLSQTFGYTGQGHYSSFGTVSPRWARTPFTLITAI